MIDENDDTIEQPEHRRPAVDPFVALTDLLHLLADQRAFKRNMQAHHRATVAADKAQKRLARDRAAFDEYEQNTRAELSTQKLKLHEEQTVLLNAKDAREDDLVARERRIAKLEAEWKFVAEDDDVRRGFRAAEFSALMKARAAYGIAETSLPIVKELPGHWHDSEFPPDVTLSRDRTTDA
jgi:hypothetical protein